MRCLFMSPLSNENFKYGSKNNWSLQINLYIITLCSYTQFAKSWLYSDVV